jgi:nitric oxide synthase-interacting protein
VPPTPAETDDEPPAKKKKKGKKDEAPYVCGHVVCKNCADTIVKPAGRCCVCEAEVDDAGRIPLGKEGELHPARAPLRQANADAQEPVSPLQGGPRSSPTG